MEPGPAPVELSDDAVPQAVRGLFGRDSVYILVWALQLAAAAALTPVITRVVTASQFGGVGSALAVMTVLFVIAGLGLQTAIQRHFAQRGAVDARRLLMLSLLLAALVTLVVDTAGPVWSGYLGFHSYTGALRLAVLWAGVSAVTNSALGLLRSQDRLGPFCAVSLMQSVVAEAMSLTLVLAVRPSAAMFVLGRLLAQLLATALALWFVPPKALRRADSALVRAALIYSLPLVPAMLSTLVVGVADRLTLNHELGPTAVARFQIAYNIGSIPILLLEVLNAAWMPRIFALGAGTRRTAVLAASRDALYRLLTPVIIGLSLGAPLVLRVWAPAEYRPDGLLLVTSIVVLSAIPYAAGMSVLRGLLAEGRTATTAVGSGVAAVVNIALNLLLVPGYGLLGAATANLAAYAVLHGLLLHRARAVAPVPRPAPARLLELAGAAAVALLAATLPTSTGYLLLRTALVLAAVGWFGRVLLQVSAGRPATARDRTGGQGKP